MLASSCVTVLYLWRHMKSMQESSSSFSAHLQKQMRVTITGIIQALLYFLCSFKLHEHILCTVILLYSFGTAINMGIDLVLFSVRASVTCSLWLNVFYYSQIVPAQHSVSIWLKKNIRVFTYFALILDKTYNLFGFIINISDNAVFFTECFKYTAGVNNTDATQNRTFATSILLSNMVLINFWIRLGLTLLNLCAMSAASCATTLYLWRHVKSMEKNSSSSLSSPHLRKQMRVTITGIIQALLYFICSTWMTLDALLRVKLPIFFDMDRHIFCTVISLYSFATTINVCVGQTTFRQRVIRLWEKFLQSSNLNE
uniref:Taste receptor type 2 n=1 Tax=Pygocentrus nattereri TaxID=42514 RepID=A0AAR2LUY7_PYGNA